jgi:hypothetical protein
MGDRRHGRVHIAGGTCALIQSRINCWYTTTAWMPKGRVGGPAARAWVFVVLVGVGCQVQTMLRLSLVAKVDLHGLHDVSLSAASSARQHAMKAWG